MKKIITILGKSLCVMLLSQNAVFAQGDWTRKADFPGEVRFEAASFAVGTKCYIGIGSSPEDNALKDFWEWDQATNIWTRKADFPGNPTHGVVSFSIGTKGYIGTSGAFGQNNEFWEYDPSKDTWTKKESIPDSSSIRHSVGFSIGAKGYIGTGWDIKKHSYSNKFWEWDQETNVWTQRADFKGEPRQNAVGFSIGTKGYIGIGMKHVQDENIAYVGYRDFWEWDQATDVWTQKADFGGSERLGAVGFSIGNKGYIGVGHLGQVASLQDFWEWDQVTNVWTQKADYNGIIGFSAVGFSVGDKGYIGLRNAYEFDNSLAYNDFWEFNPKAVQDLRNDIVPVGSTLKKLSTNQFNSAEGPVWYRDSILLFTDSPLIYFYDPVMNSLDKWLGSAQGCFALTLDMDGNLLATSSDIIMMDNSGNVLETLASEYDGKPFNNINDLIADSKGGVYFTDPDYYLTDPPQDKKAVYYIDSNESVTRVIDELDKPNGIILSPDGKKLYVVDPEALKLFSWDVESDGSVSGKSTLATLQTTDGGGGPGGIAIDIYGNIYVATKMGIQVFSSEGEPITIIELPEIPSNCDFGGKDFKTLYITSNKNLYSIDLNYPGFAVSRNNVTTPLNSISKQLLVEIYPNPVKDKFTIESTSLTGNSNLSIFNSNGQKVMERMITQSKTEIDVRILPKGMYFLRLINGNSIEKFKIVKD